MRKHAFGGSWTERKLSVVRRYLEIYSQALKDQPFEKVYVDAFAGTGERIDRRNETQLALDIPNLESVMKGSARLALEVEPRFHRYFLIEQAGQKASSLEILKSDYPGHHIEIINADANDAIVSFCASTDWRRTRGVVFLDPYGLQVSWDTLLAISRTKALDVWILFPSGMGLNRLLTKSGDIPEVWQQTLDRSLGTKEWRAAFYRSEDIGDLFEGHRTQTVKDAGTEKMQKFYLNRLRTIFPTVSDECVRLTNSKDQAMYLLCFASANQHPKVKSLALKLATWAAKV